MAKIVIAGRSDCPYFARVELLGDSLAKNVPHFDLHKIVVKPDQWQEWLDKTNQERGWNHKTSPLIWRELIDRGGKGVVIGNASDFQEYAKGYYDQYSTLTSEDMLKNAEENRVTKEEVDKEEEEFKKLSHPLNVCIVGAASPTCYALINSFARGHILGHKTEINLRLLELSDDAMEPLQGLKMEIEDLAYGLVRGIEPTQKRPEAFAECSMIVILAELQKEEEETFEAYVLRNSELYTQMAREINDTALKTVRVMVAGNAPVNTITMMMIKNAPLIPRQNFVALSTVVENRAKAAMAQKLNVNTAGVVDLIVWGNINGVNYLDTSKSRVHGYDGAIWGPEWFSLPVEEMVHDRKWMEGSFLQQVSARGARVLESLRHAPATTFSQAITTTLYYWWQGSPLGQIFSLGVFSEGWYDIPEGFVFSYPVIFTPQGYWKVVEDMELTEKAKQLIKDCVQDLANEYLVIFPPPKPPTPPVEEEEGKEGDETAEGKSSEVLGTEMETLLEVDEEGETSRGRLGGASSAQTPAASQSAPGPKDSKMSESNMPVSSSEELFSP